MQSEDIRSLHFFVALWKLSVRIFFIQLNWAVVIRPDDADLMDASILAGWLHSFCSFCSVRAI